MGERSVDFGHVLHAVVGLLVIEGRVSYRRLQAEFDLDAKTWTIPGSRMKAGVDHRVPLSARCLEILERAKGVSRQDCIALAPSDRAKHQFSRRRWAQASRAVAQGYETIVAAGGRRRSYHLIEMPWTLLGV